jgi:hypothetical protein
MLIHARANEAVDEPKGQWQVFLHIDSLDGEHTRVLGLMGEGGVSYKFDTESACKEFIRTSPKVQQAVKAITPIISKWKPPGRLVLDCKAKPDTI